VAAVLNAIYTTRRYKAKETTAVIDSVLEVFKVVVYTMVCWCKALWFLLVIRVFNYRCVVTVTGCKSQPTPEDANADGKQQNAAGIQRQRTPDTRIHLFSFSLSLSLSLFCFSFFHG